MTRPAADLGGFGYKVAISGDTAAVVAIQGPAFIYTLGPRGWSSTPVTTLNAPAVSGQFGRVVALSGTTLAISDPNITPESVYLYTEGPGGWPTTPTVAETDPRGYAGDAQNDGFGASLARSGTTLLIGSANVNDNGDGVVYGYSDGPGGWPTTPTVMLADPQASDGCFGESGLSLSGTTALIGDGCGNRTNGAVYAYSETESGWRPTPVAMLPDPVHKGSSYFGTVLDVSDGTAIVSAWGIRSSSGPRLRLHHG